MFTLAICMLNSTSVCYEYSKGHVDKPINSNGMSEHFGKVFDRCNLVK